MTPNEIKQKIIEACPDVIFHKHLSYRGEIVVEVELHHVLQAVFKYHSYVSVNSLGILQNIREEDVKWNLTKDFDGQTDEVKTFIGDLLNP